MKMEEKIKIYPKTLDVDGCHGFGIVSTDKIPYKDGMMKNDRNDLLSRPVQ